MASSATPASIAAQPEDPVPPSGSATPVAVDRLWYNRGKMLLQQGQYESALASFDVALKLQPHHPQTWIFRGVILTHLKLYKSALASFDQAVKLEPTDRDAWTFRGAVLNYLHRTAEALESYNVALRLPRSPAIHDYPMWAPTGKNRVE